MNGVLRRTARRLSFRPQPSAAFRAAVLALLQSGAVLLLALEAAPQGPAEQAVVVRGDFDLAPAAAIITRFNYQARLIRAAGGLVELHVDPMPGQGVETAASDVADLLADLPVVVSPRAYLDPLWEAPDSSAARLGGLTALAAAGVLLLGNIRGAGRIQSATRRRLQELGLSTGELRALFFLQAGWAAAPAVALSAVIAVSGSALVPGLLNAWLAGALAVTGLASAAAMVLARRDLGGGLVRGTVRP